MWTAGALIRLILSFIARNDGDTLPSDIPSYKPQKYLGNNPGHSCGRRKKWGNSRIFIRYYVRSCGLKLIKPQSRAGAAPRKITRGVCSIRLPYCLTWKAQNSRMYGGIVPPVVQAIAALQSLLDSIGRHRGWPAGLHAI